MRSASRMIVATVAFCLSLFSVASHATIITTAANGANGTFSVSASDLLENSLASATVDAGGGDFGSSEPSLRDAAIYGVGGVSDTADSLTPTNGTIVTYNLDVSLNTLGYDLTSITSLTGSGFGQNRSGQIYDVEVSLVGNVSFAPLFNVTGAFVDVFVSGLGLNGPVCMKFRPDGNVYVSNLYDNSITRFNATTGAFVDAFVTSGSGGLRFPHYFMFTNE